MAGIRVLVPFDRSKPARRGLEVALQLARVDRRKSRVCPIYVVEVGREYSLDNLLPQAEARAEACLAEAEAAAKQVKVQVESILLQARNAGPAIVDAAVAEAIDLVVIGVGHADIAVGRAGAQTALARHNNAAIDLGSTADYVLSHAPCEVIVVREHLNEPDSANE